MQRLFTQDYRLECRETDVLLPEHIRAVGAAMPFGRIMLVLRGENNDELELYSDEAFALEPQASNVVRVVKRADRPKLLADGILAAAEKIRRNLR